MSKWMEAAEAALKVVFDKCKVPYDFERFECDKKQLPDTYAVYFLVSEPSGLSADNKEVSSLPRIQVSLYYRDKSVVRTVPDEILGAFISKGFSRASTGRIPYQQNTGHHGWRYDFIFYESR